LQIPVQINPATSVGAEAIQSDAADRDTIISLVKSRGQLDVLVVNAGTLVLGNPL
jgi:cyclic-di-GMP-binding biofilm dispersal mediator protein